MRPRIPTRTAQVVAMATGLAAFGGTGTAVADASPSSEPAPDELGVAVPLAHCPARPGTTPCADSHLSVSSPNLVKKVGSDVVRTAEGVVGELHGSEQQDGGEHDGGNQQDGGEPVLSSDKPTRVLGHVFAETTRLNQTTRMRPTVDVRVDPAYEGVLEPLNPDAGLLRATIGPRGPQHEGVSALDTAIDVTAARGYAVGSVTSAANAVVSTVQSPLGPAGGGA